MRTIVVCLLFCASVLVANADDIHVVTWSYKVLPENSLATIEVFTRDGQTNLIRHTHTRDGQVLFRSQSFFHDGVEVGIYSFELSNGTNTMIGSGPGSPYSLTFILDASNQPRSAVISTIRTNNVTPPTITVVTLDSFGYTNGVFYPRDSSWLRKVNSMRNAIPLPH